jgi:Uma2 family endonuclease
MVIRDRLITADEFEQMLALPENSDRLLELIDGELVEKPMPTQQHGRIVIRLGARLLAFVEDQRLGHIETEVRYRTAEDDLNTRQPDLSFFAGVDVPAVERGPVMRLPDLAIEVKSPDDTFLKLREKALYYLKHGSRLVWLIFPERQQVEVHTADGPILTLGADHTLDGGEVLPGFSLPVADVFPK